MQYLEVSGSIASREALLRALGENKDRTSIPRADLEKLDAALVQRWGVDFFETGLDLVHYVTSVVSADAGTRYRTATEGAARSLRRGGNETAVYAAMCEPELLAPVTASRRALLLDSVAMTLALVRELGITGPLVDVGCHAGIGTDILAEVTSNPVHGIDPLPLAIQTARARSDRRIQYDVAGLPWDTDKRFELVVAIDSMPSSLLDRAKFLKGAGDVLVSGGVVVIVSAHLIDADVTVLRRQLADAGLGYGFADVVGGYSGAPTQFAVETCLILIKGGKEQLPRKLALAAQSEWDAFKHYANSPGTPSREKIQSFKRARANPA